MQWLKGTYERLHLGAGGANTDPDGWELYIGGNYPTWRQIFKPHEVDAADLNAVRHFYKQVPALGRAASVQAEIPGVPSSDRSHNLALDGHRDSALSSHPDGLYAQNTAATDDYSLGANLATFRGPYPAGGLRPVALPNYTEFVTGSMAGEPGTIRYGQRGKTPSQLSAQRTRAPHLQDQPELFISAESQGAYRVRSLLEREWSTPELGLLAAGAYVAVSMA